MIGCLLIPKPRSSGESCGFAFVNNIVIYLENTGSKKVEHTIMEGQGHIEHCIVQERTVF